MSFVYFIQDEAGLVKIGTTGNVTRRLQTLQTGHSQRLKIIGSIRGGVPEEKGLHAKFQEKRRSGEWFRLADRDVDFLLTLAASEGGEADDDDGAERDEFTAQAKGWADYLERRIARIETLSYSEARAVLSARSGLLCGFLENLRKTRITAISHRAYIALRKLYLAEIEGEIRELAATHQRVSGAELDLADEHVSEIEAHLATVKALLNSGRAAE